MEQTLIINSIILWIVVICNVLLTLAIIRKVNTPRVQEGGLHPGKRVPNFSFQNLKGDTATQKDFEGRKVAFVYLSTHCKPCRESLPEIQALYANKQKTAMDLVLVSSSNIDETKSLMDELGITLPVFVAPSETNPFEKDFHIRGTPSYCVVNDKGIVEASGFLNLEDNLWRNLTDSMHEITSESNPIPEKGGVIST